MAKPQSKYHRDQVPDATWLPHGAQESPLSPEDGEDWYETSDGAWQRKDAAYVDREQRMRLDWWLRARLAP